jgi:hypothetical protein
MPETLLSPSQIKLYGRALVDLEIKHNYKNPKPPPEDIPTHPPGLGDNRFLWEQLTDVKPEERCFARIYAFSYEGHFYELNSPSIFLVHGPGAPVTDAKAGGSVGPGTVDESGVPAKGWDFMEDIKMWEYDKGDFSMRLDVDSGQFEQILLEATLQPEAYFGGARVSGARVSGARVSGARVSGARVSGARVSGGNSGD